MSWINHLPPACWSAFWKSNFKQQLGCRFDIMDNESYFFVFWHMQLYMSWYIRSFFGFTFLNILSSTLVLTSSYRRSLYTFYWNTSLQCRHIEIHGNNKHNLNLNWNFTDSEKKIDKRYIKWNAIRKKFHKKFYTIKNRVENSMEKYLAHAQLLLYAALLWLKILQIMALSNLTCVLS